MEEVGEKREGHGGEAGEILDGGVEREPIGGAAGVACVGGGEGTFRTGGNLHACRSPKPDINGGYSSAVLKRVEKRGEYISAKLRSERQAALAVCPHVPVRDVALGDGKRVGQGL